MNPLRESDDYEPMARVNGIPIYATTLLVILHSLALLASWTAESLQATWLLEQLRFSSEAVLDRGAIWQWFTYAWVEPIANPLFFVIGMLMLYVFGREVERALGRRHYLLLYLLLIVAPPVLLTAAGFWRPFMLAGAGHLYFTLFIGFALLYPGVEFFLRIRAIWLAMVLLAVYGFYYLAAGEWSALITLTASVATLRLFLWWVNGEGIFAPREAREPPPVAERDPMDAIDPLLEKIAREGMASLTARELNALQRARDELLARQETGG